MPELHITGTTRTIGEMPRLRWRPHRYVASTPATGGELHRSLDATGTGGVPGAEAACEYVEGRLSFDDLCAALGLAPADAARWLEVRGFERAPATILELGVVAMNLKIQAARGDRLARQGGPVSPDEARDLARGDALASSRIEGVDLLSLDPETWRGSRVP
jgi:hypothetical protein